MIRGLILPPCAQFPLPQAQPPALQALLSSSSSLAMPSSAALSMSPGLVCPHQFKGDMPHALG